MASTASSRAVVGGRAAGLAALLALLAVAGASTLTLFEGPGCTGATENDWDCDTCHNINLRGGYDFVYTHLEFGLLFDGDDCAESSLAKILSKDEWHCTSVNHRSLMIRCVDGLGSRKARNVTKAPQ